MSRALNVGTEVEPLRQVRDRPVRFLRGTSGFRLVRQSGTVHLAFRSYSTSFIQSPDSFFSYQLNTERRIYSNAYLCKVFPGISSSLVKRETIYRVNFLYPEGGAFKLKCRRQFRFSFSRKIYPSIVYYSNFGLHVQRAI